MSAAAAKGPVVRLAILETCTDPGEPGGVNEDAFGANAGCAFVIDGATGLGDTPVVATEGSDAQWLAQMAAAQFAEGLADGVPVGDVVRRIGALAAGAVAQVGKNVPAWALPVAGFQMIRIEAGWLVTHGLGDCRLFLAAADGTVIEASAIEQAHAAEREAARRAVAHAGGLGELKALARHPDVREKLREARARYNEPGGLVWTLGTAPEAADHVATRALAPALPATGLVCTDGFAALVDQYGAYGPGDLIEAARRSGLAALVAELRDIERNRDPDGRLYPRFKTSDDATAILFEVAGP